MHLYYQDWIIVIHCSREYQTLPREVYSLYRMLQLTRTRKFVHITTILASLHWLPITSRSDFKVLLLTYKALHGISPSYLKDVIIPYSPSRSLRSSGAGLLSLLKVKKKSAGQRAFAYWAPFLWNRLPPVIREADSVELIKGKLKKRTSTILHLEHRSVKTTQMRCEDHSLFVCAMNNTVYISIMYFPVLIHCSVFLACCGDWTGCLESPHG